MAHNYRCSLHEKCGKCKTLHKYIDQYVTRPLCPGCGEDTLKPVAPYKKVDPTMCQCDGYPTSHRKGIVVTCLYYPVGPDWQTL